MGRGFDEFIHELDAEARSKGPRAVAEAAAFDAHFKLAGQFIKRRQELGFTQRQLADKCGIQQSEISRVEAGTANPTFQTIHVLGRALGVELRLVRRRGGKRGAKPIRQEVIETGRQSKPLVAAAIERPIRHHGKTFRKLAR